MSLPATVLLVRHAWAGERGSVADDRTRPLDARGRRQADALPAHLDSALAARGRPGLVDSAAAGTLALCASPYTRCVDTLVPVAAMTGLAVSEDDRFAETGPTTRSSDGWPDAAELGARAWCALEAAAGRTPAAGTLVVCAHGEVLPALVAVLVGQGILAPPAVDLTAKAMAKGATWVVTPGAGLLEELPPPA